MNSSSSHSNPENDEIEFHIEEIKIGNCNQTPVNLFLHSDQSIQPEEAPHNGYFAKVELAEKL